MLLLWVVVSVSFYIIVSEQTILKDNRKCKNPTIYKLKLRVRYEEHEYYYQGSDFILENPSPIYEEILFNK